MRNKVIIMTCLAIIISGIRTDAGTEIWKTDFEKAKKEAGEKKQPIMAVFSGSDWCSWCIKLEKEILHSDEFRNYAKDNLVLFLADFPSSTKLPEKTAEQNKQLAEKYKVQGFPTVLLLDKEGKIIGKTGYMKGGPEAYVKHIKSMLTGK